MRFQKDVPEEIRKFYKKNLSNYDIVYKHLKSTYLFYASLPLYCIGGVLVFYKNGAYDLWAIPFLLPFVIATYLLPMNARRYLSKKWGFEIKTTLQMFQAIQAYRAEEMTEILETSNYDSVEKIEDLISILSIANERSRFQKLFPYTLLAAFLWHIWGEYVGFRFNALMVLREKIEWGNQAILLCLKLTGAAIIIWAFVVLLVSTFRMILLHKVNKDESLCKLLRDILHEMKRLKTIVH